MYDIASPRGNTRSDYRTSSIPQNRIEQHLQGLQAVQSPPGAQEILFMDVELNLRNRKTSRTCKLLYDTFQMRLNSGVDLAAKVRDVKFVLPAFTNVDIDPSLGFFLPLFTQLNDLDPCH